MLQKIKLFLLRIQNRLFKKNCYYINGPETLPPPLTKEEEETVMRELRAGNDTHRELLITHNLRLVVYIAKNSRAAQLQRKILFLSARSV